MAISIKNKIRLGTLFLFLLLISSGGLSIYYLIKLKTDSGNIVKDNYETLDYCHDMQKQLDSIRSNFSLSVSKFDSSLKQQEQNITEPGEKDETKLLRQSFDNIAKGDTAELNFENTKRHIQTIISLNMQAIERKNRVAQQSAESASTFLIMIVAITFIVGLTFSYNFPDIVVTPIKKLTEAVKEISIKNYKHRIHLDNKDEFGQLADAFNNMTERLEGFENSNLNKVMFEKARAEAVINSLKDASIGIDKNNCVLFANQQALQLLGLKAEDTVGKSTGD
jgi:nitrogen fixation/metabolism regulation signal transduction histidine kinase